MLDLLRDSAFGHCVRLVTGRKYLQYPEERDHEIWKKYVSHEKSGYAAYHGHTHPPQDNAEEALNELTQAHGVRSRERHDSDTTAVGEGVNEASGVRVDPEKGKDVHVVDWYGPDDAQVCLSVFVDRRIVLTIPWNPRNWSRGKRYFVTFEICFLTFSVYIGSAIYTPGLMGVMQQFGVAQVPATLGLTLYVAGYGLGPLLWSPMSEIPQIGRLWVYIGTLCKSMQYFTRNRYNANVVVHSRLRPLSAAYRVFGQLWHAACLSVPNWLLRLSRSCYRWGFHRRHVSTQETGLWHGCVGCRGSLRARARSPGRRICRHGRRLEVDNLGTDVAIRRLLGVSILLPTRDKFAKHLVPQDKAAEKVDWRRSVYLRAGDDSCRDDCKGCGYSPRQCRRRRRS